MYGNVLQLQGFTAGAALTVCVVLVILVYCINDLKI